MSDIKNRIRGLLKLAEDGSGASPHECEAALTKAYDLMRKYHIEMHELRENEYDSIRLSNADIIKHTLVDRSQLDPWHVSLASAAALMSGCKLVRGQYDAQKRWILWLAGFKDDVEIAVSIYEWLDQQMRNSWAIAGVARSRRAMESFYSGFSTRMHQRGKHETSHEQQRALEAPDSEEAVHQLIIVGKNQLVDANLARLFCEEFRGPRKSPKRTIDEAYYSRGKAAANRATFVPAKGISGNG